MGVVSVLTQRRGGQNKYGTWAQCMQYIFGRLQFVKGNDTRGVSNVFVFCVCVCVCFFFLGGGFVSDTVYIIMNVSVLAWWQRHVRYT